MTGLEAALAELIPMPKQPGEFTAIELWEKSGGKASGSSLTSIRCRLDRAVKDGHYVMRKTVSNGTSMNVYRKP